MRARAIIPTLLLPILVACGQAAPTAIPRPETAETVIPWVLIDQPDTYAGRNVALHGRAIEVFLSGGREGIGLDAEDDLGYPRRIMIDLAPPIGARPGDCLQVYGIVDNRYALVVRAYSAARATSCLAR